MSATDELRKLLDERGVEHKDKHTELVPDISDWDSTWWQGIAGMTFLAIEDKTCGREGCVYINNTHLTPEQAIAATLERGTCEPDEAGYCPYCGEDLVRCDIGIGAGGGAVELDPPIYYNFCPNCGRRVKGGEE